MRLRLRMHDPLRLGHELTPGGAGARHGGSAVTLRQLRRPRETARPPVLRSAMPSADPNVHHMQRASRRDGSPEAAIQGAEATAPVVDRGTFHRLVEIMGDPEFVAELLDTFAAEASAMIGGLDEAIGEKSAVTVWRVAHTLKSNAAPFGAMALSDACRALEALAKNGALDGAGVLILPVLSALVTSLGLLPYKCRPADRQRRRSARECRSWPPRSRACPREFRPSATVLRADGLVRVRTR